MQHKETLDIVKKIKEHKIIAIPTDTIYGLSGLIEEKVILKMQQLKKRSFEKGFILLSSYIEHFMPFLNLDKICDKDFEILNTEQEIPTTFIVPAKEELTWLHKGSHNIAIRLTLMPLIYEITSLLNTGIISTSANLSGQKPAMDNREIFSYFGNNVEYFHYSNQVLMGRYNKPSRIIDLLTKKIIRD